MLNHINIINSTISNDVNLLISDLIDYLTKKDLTTLLLSNYKNPYFEQHQLQKQSFFKMFANTKFFQFNDYSIVMRNEKNIIDIDSPFIKKNFSMIISLSSALFSFNFDPTKCRNILLFDLKDKNNIEILEIINFININLRKLKKINLFYLYNFNLNNTYHQKIFYQLKKTYNGIFNIDTIDFPLSTSKSNYFQYEKIIKLILNLI